MSDIRNIRESLQDLANELTQLEYLDDHECSSYSEEDVTDAYVKGKAELRKELLDRVDTYIRQSGIGLVNPYMMLEDVKEMIKWAGR